MAVGNTSEICTTQIRHTQMDRGKSIYPLTSEGIKIIYIDALERLGNWSKARYKMLV